MTRRKDDESPRGRLLQHGAECLSDSELLGILLRSDSEEMDELLDEIGGLRRLVNFDRSKLRHLCTEARTTNLQTIVEIACRIARAKIPDQVLLASTDTIATYLQMRYANDDQELMGALYLNKRNRLVHEAVIFRGTICSVAAEPRAILCEALACHAARIIVFHNHPTGDPAPSAEDISFTKNLSDACNLMKIELRDHIILGVNRWVSFRDEERDGGL